MNEVLYGIRVVKFYAWEEHFRTRIQALREAELKSLKGRKYLDAMCVYFWATTPVLISILTFTTYSLMGNQLTAAKVSSYGNQPNDMYMHCIIPVTTAKVSCYGNQASTYISTNISNMLICNQLTTTKASTCMCIYGN